MKPRIEGSGETLCYICKKDIGFIIHGYNHKFCFECYQSFREWLINEKNSRSLKMKHKFNLACFFGFHDWDLNSNFLYIGKFKWYTLFIPYHQSYCGRCTELIIEAK